MQPQDGDGRDTDERTAREHVAPHLEPVRRDARSGLVLPFIVSVLFNVVGWTWLYPRIFAVAEPPDVRVVVASVRVEARPTPIPRPSRRPTRPPHVRPKPSPSPSVARARPSRPLRAPRKPPVAVASESLIPATNQVVRMKLPASWSNLDMGAATAQDSAIYLDFKHARGAFVPRILVMQLKTTFLSGPTLHDAVHDITDGLQSEGADMHASRAERVCGGKRSGWFLSYDRRRDDPPTDFDEVLILAEDTVYRISYSRPAGTPEDTRTRAALQTICPLPRS